MIIKINDNIESTLHIEFSKIIYLIPKIKRFGYKKEINKRSIIFDIHFLFIKIYFYVWSRIL